MSFSLDDLAQRIETRAESADEKSYTRHLLSKGVEKCAQKLGEEAVEAAIAAALRDKEALKNEAADVLYHLLVLLKAGGVSLDAVMEELSARTAQSGLEEKASRSAGS